MNENAEERLWIIPKILLEPTLRLVLHEASTVTKYYQTTRWLERIYYFLTRVYLQTKVLGAGFIHCLTLQRG